MIIFINGSINSGKTTVANILVAKIPKTAHIEIDSLRRFISWMSLDESIPINLENTASIIKNFVKSELNVVVTYPLSQKNYDYLLGQLADLNEKIYAFTLNPKLNVVLTKRGTRKIVGSEKKRIKYHYKIGINNPSFGEVIDNSNQTPEETVKIILDSIGLQPPE